MSQKLYLIVLFEDGLQIIPNSWLNKDVNTAKWPNFTTNKRYDKAVKFMEKPQSTWLEHPVLKIYGEYGKQCYIHFLVTHYFLCGIYIAGLVNYLFLSQCYFSANYAVARRKLKEAEEFSDLDSCTEQEEHRQKSRKIRAAKTVDSSSNDEGEEEEEMKEVMIDLPKPPSKHSILNQKDMGLKRKIDTRKGKV